MRRLRPIVLVLLVLILLPGCRRQAQEGEVWFVQITDPHLYYGDATPEISQRQEPMNQEAFSHLIAGLEDLPGGDPEPSFLVVSGDFGLDLFADELEKAAGTPAPQTKPAPAATPAPAESPTLSPTPTVPPIPPSTPPSTPTQAPAASPGVDSAVKLVVDILAKSPVKDIYMVLGNNDVKDEAPAGPEVAAAQLFWNRVQQGLAGTGVTLHDLSSCYFGDELPSGCYADIAGTSYRLVGFPSQSFKNGMDPARSKVQLEQLGRLAGLVSEAGRQRKRVLIVTHIAEIDDPYKLAVNQMQKDPDKTKWASGRPDWSAASPWNVPKEVFDKWKEVVDSRTVAGVLAGHFHDSHKEIYRQPYDWATASPERASPSKLYLAPPLSMRLQDTSPIQARGFAMFHLRDGDDPERALYWYDAKTKGFEQDEAARLRRSETTGRPWDPIVLWFWKLAGDVMDLSKAAVIAIAFLAAFLTIVELWEIPPPKTPLAPGATPPTPPTANDFSVFKSNFVKTVLAGLGGMLVLSFLESIWSAKEFNTRAYYVVLFVVFFFLMLLLYAVIQALIEGLRSRILTQHPARAWRPAVPREGADRRKRSDTYRFSTWLSYWRSRFWNWFLSLRAFFLVFFDTFSNVIRGRNQLRTVVFEKAIVDLHWGIVRAADHIREEIERAILQALGGQAVDEDIRVSVSVLSEDESVLFYVAREQGSLGRGFDKRSVAWVSVYTDTALWWKKDYPPDAELLDNTSGGYPLLPAEKILLGAYYQARAGQDYDAFLVLPVPWAKRAVSDTVRKAGIQISFRTRDHMDALFRLPTKDANKPDYSAWASLLEDKPPSEVCAWTKDDQLRHGLRHSLLLLEDLFAPFNEAVFDMYVRPHLRPR